MVGQTAPLPHDRKSARFSCTDLGSSCIDMQKNNQKQVRHLSRIHKSEEKCASAD